MPDIMKGIIAILVIVFIVAPAVSELMSEKHFLYGREAYIENFLKGNFWLAVIVVLSWCIGLIEG